MYHDDKHLKHIQTMTTLYQWELLQFLESSKIMTFLSLKTIDYLYSKVSTRIQLTSIHERCHEKYHKESPYSQLSCTDMPHEIKKYIY